MRAQTLVVVLICLCPLSSWAQPVVSIHDQGEGVFDIGIVDLAGGSRWTTGGVFGETFGGAGFRYGYDPNTTELDLHPPASSLPRVIVSRPCGLQNDQSCRYLDENDPAIAGRYRNGIGDPIARSRMLDVAIFDFPGRQAGVGYFAQIALDLRDTGISPGLVFATAGVAPAGTTLLARGVATATTDQFPFADQAEISWSVYAVPEPATVAVFAIVAIGRVWLRQTAGAA